MVTINQTNTIIDHIWAWRADHSTTEGQGLGPTNCMSDHGLVVNADNVTGYGVFSEHHLKECVVWAGANGRLFFMQCELAYDIAQIPGWDYPGMRVTGKGFVGTNIGVYTFFAKTWGSKPTIPSIKTSCVTPPDSIISGICNVFLDDVDGDGCMRSVVNEKGQGTNALNKDQPIWCAYGANLCADQCGHPPNKNTASISM